MYIEIIITFHVALTRNKKLIETGLQCDHLIIINELLFS